MGDEKVASEKNRAKVTTLDRVEWKRSPSGPVKEGRVWHSTLDCDLRDWFYGNKRFIVSTLHGMHWGNACCIRWKTMDFSVRKEGLPMFYLHYVSIEGKKIWVAMSVGTLVINEWRMLKDIHVEILSFTCTYLGSWSAYSRRYGPAVRMK